MYWGASPYSIKGTPSPSNATSQANQGNISYKQSGLTTCATWASFLFEHYLISSISSRRHLVTSAHTWIQFEVSSQQTLLTEDLGDYIMYHILGLNWASWKILGGLSPLFMYWGASPYSIKGIPSPLLESIAVYWAIASPRASTLAHIYVLRSEPLFYKRDSLTIIR